MHSPADASSFPIAADTTPTMMPKFLRFEPGAAFPSTSGTPVEWVYVPAGELESELKGASARTFLGRGDSAYYRADRPHLFRNASATEPLTLVCAVSPPNL